MIEFAENLLAVRLTLGLRSQEPLSDPRKTAPDWWKPPRANQFDGDRAGNAAASCAYDHNSKYQI